MNFLAAFKVATRARTVRASPTISCVKVRIRASASSGEVGSDDTRDVTPRTGASSDSPPSLSSRFEEATDVVASALISVPRLRAYSLICSRTHGRQASSDGQGGGILGRVVNELDVSGRRRTLADRFRKQQVLGSNP